MALDGFLLCVFVIVMRAIIIGNMRVILPNRMYRPFAQRLTASNFGQLHAPCTIADFVI